MSTDLDIHPDMARLLEAKASVDPNPESSGSRDNWLAYGHALEQPHPRDMSVYDALFPPFEDDSAPDIPVRVYRPGWLRGAAPCVVFFHGGGFVKGDLDSSDTIAWGIADITGTVVVSVAYRLAPENPYPAALEDCYAAVKHCADNAAELNIDDERLAVWGDSAGGTMAAAVCLLARDRNGPLICAQALNYPCLTDTLSASSYTEFADSPGLSSSNMDFYWDQYLGDSRPTSDGYAAPLKAADLTGLPPAHVHIAQYDPLADDGRMYAARLKEAGVKTQLRVAPRMVHGFLRARFDGPDAAAEFAAPCQFLSDQL